LLKIEWHRQSVGFGALSLTAINLGVSLMKNDTSQSNKPSTSQTGSVADRQHSRESGQANQQQPQMSNDTSKLKSVNSKQQGSVDQSSGRQQQADTGNNKNGQTSPSRDEGHSASGSSNSNGRNDGSDSSPRQTGKNV
jgi:hypothetical protein